MSELLSVSSQQYSHEDQRFNEALVASFIERPQEQQEFERLPAHLTYVPWFHLDQDAEVEFYEHVQQVTEDYRAPHVTGGIQQISYDHEERQVLSHRQIKVPTSHFNALQDFMPHITLMRHAQELDSSLGTTIAAMQQWRPHIADTPERSVQQGEEVLFDNLAIVRRSQKLGRHIIAKVFTWEHSGE